MALVVPIRLPLSSLYFLVCMVRDPVQSIPSMVSYISKVWHVFASPRFEYPNARDLLEFCRQHYSYPMELWGNQNDSCEPNGGGMSSSTRDVTTKRHALYVYHHRLCMDLIGTISSSFEALQVPYTAAFLDGLKQEAAISQSFVRKTCYAEFELTPYTNLLLLLPFITKTNA